MRGLDARASYESGHQPSTINHQHNWNPVLESHQPLRLCRSPPELLGQRDEFITCNNQPLRAQLQHKDWMKCGMPTKSPLVCIVVIEVALLFSYSTWADSWA